jgi:hypothetical protein
MFRCLLALLVCSLPTSDISAESADPDRGAGWTMTRLDLDVRLERDKPSLFVHGTMTLRLDLETSPGPTLWLNTVAPGMQWSSLSGEKVARVDYGTAERLSDCTQFAAVRLQSEAREGQEILLEFTLEKVGDSGQLVTRPDIALASWIEAWYPVALIGPENADPFSAKWISIPGTTSFDLPGDWIAMTDGRLLHRERRGDRAIEAWDLGNTPVARSFAAGPFTSSERTLDGRSIRILLSHDHVMSADDLAELIAASMAAQEARLGPFPFAGYGVVEVPDGLQGWGAASQQTFIMAKSENFDYEHGNLPLFAHEMGHGWWGNTVGTKGPGSKMAGEALAQFGVLISLEALEGTEAMVKFLEFSRSGYNVMQCARGYFSMIEQGTDCPLATLGDSDLSGNLTHNLADSKGMWVYHMLRRRIGDDIFFSTLGDLIDSYAGSEMSLDDIRDAFIDAAPDHGLDRFFAQWLDRPGAPRFDISWTTEANGQAEIVLRQAQDREPFELDLDLELVLAEGTTQRERVRVLGHETTIDCAVPGEITEINLDPARDHLIWHPTYVMAPLVDGVPLPATAEWVDVSAYVGTYHIEMLEMDVEVFVKNDGLWVRLADDVQQLFPLEPQHFLTLDAEVEFNVENGRATGFSVELQSGDTVEGVRID